jgi:DNA helicase-2/ATP-dependent DNA helicase PcrA
VVIATVHQAKGIQWPAVFVPALRKNRFPSKRQGGLNVFHVIPDQDVPDADRYRGTQADEVRLFYVAVTRAQKHLFMYGFNAPIDKALGFGKSPHDVMAEIHKRAIEGDIVTDREAEVLVDRHLNAPFADPQLKETLRAAAVKAVVGYIAENRTRLPQTLYSEQQVQVHVAPGITVDGRIDLIRRLDTNETSIVDFKSSERVQAEETTRDQLHVYAVGYQELTGERADLVEVLNLDQRAASKREVVNDALLTDIRTKIRNAGDDLRANRLPRLQSWCTTCESCDLAGLCRSQGA